jgi:hypothetical protein
MKPIRILSSLLVAGSLAQAPAAFAVSTWDLTTPCTSTSGLGNTRTCTGGATSVSATAWSNTGNFGTTYTAAEVLGYGGGLGVRNAAETLATPEHSMDNLTPGRDMILLSFGSAVTLSQLTLGWVSGDSDISVLAYTGGSAPAISGKTAGSLTSTGGWSLVGNYDGGATASTMAINAGNLSSSWWLVSAYNSSFGGSLSTGNDYVKLFSVAGNLTTPPGGAVPEPTSLALAAAALFGLWSIRRRAPRRVAVRIG